MERGGLAGGSCTCACPAVEMVQAGYGEVIAVATEPGELYRDIFGREPIPEVREGAPIYVIRPERDLVEMGVNFTDVSEEGMVAVYEHGMEKGREFVDYSRLMRRYTS